MLRGNRWLFVERSRQGCTFLDLKYQLSKRYLIKDNCQAQVPKPKSPQSEKNHKSPNQRNPRMEAWRRCATNKQPSSNCQALVPKPKSPQSEKKHKSPNRWETAERPLRGHWETTERPVRNRWETTERPPRDCWETTERLLRDRWETAERLLRDRWETAERPLRDRWETAERPLRDRWENHKDWMKNAKYHRQTHTHRHTDRVTSWAKKHYPEKFKNFPGEGRCLA